MGDRKRAGKKTNAKDAPMAYAPHVVGDDVWGAIGLEQANGAGEMRRRGADERIAEAGTPRAIALAAALLFSLYVGLVLGYRDAIPLFEAPDEPSHLHYALFLHNEGRLPRHPAEVPGVGAQPPLVYSVAAPLVGAAEFDRDRVLDTLDAVGRAVYRDEPTNPSYGALALAPRGARLFVTDGSLRLLRNLRGASLAFGLLAVIFTFAAVWRVGRDARLAMLAASLLAFNPQFLFTSATLSNHTGAAAVGAAALWVVLRALEEGGPSRSHYLIGAIVMAFGLLTRLSTLPALAVGAVVIVMIDRRPPSDRRIDLALATGLVLLVAGPYLLWSLEHRETLLGFETVRIAGAGVPTPEEIGGRATWFTHVYWDRTFESYWGSFGWRGVPMPKAFYYAFFAIVWTGILGYFAGRVPEANALLRERALHFYLFMTIAATWATHLAVNLFVPLADGVSLFAVAPHVGLLLALGLGRLLGHGHRTLAMTVAIVAGLVIIDLVVLRSVLIPAYLTG